MKAQQISPLLFWWNNFRLKSVRVRALLKVRKHIFLYTVRKILTEMANVLPWRPYNKDAFCILSRETLFRSVEKKKKWLRFSRPIPRKTRICRPMVFRNVKCLCDKMNDKWLASNMFIRRFYFWWFLSYCGRTRGKTRLIRIT